MIDAISAIILTIAGVCVLFSFFGVWNDLANVIRAFRRENKR